jgi:SAM-dependent methyltransferase
VSSLDRFLQSYQILRRAEGWGAPDAVYYQNLPRVAPDDPHRAIWQVRAASLQALLRILGSRRHVLDLGAGNGWLSYQLARCGHSVVAVDVNDDEQDGLGALQNYPLAMEAYQADFSTLPFENARFDCVLYSASLHYAREILPVIAEGLRVLAPGGMMIVMDSPLYYEAESGRAMFADKRRSMRKRYGVEIAPDQVGFLTFADFEHLAQVFALDWQWIEPFVGVLWSTRHLRARLRRQREPARFGLMVGHRNMDGLAP